MTEDQPVERRAWRRKVPSSAVLASFLLLAFGLRIFALAGNPPELFEDELAPPASAWSIVTTGHDVGPTVLPYLVTRLEMHPPVYGFSTVPFQAVLGHTILAVRLPAVLFGILTSYLIYWVTRVLGRRRGEALVAVFIFAVTPWAVHYGRIGWEPSSVLPFTVGGVGLLWDGLARRRPRRVVAGAVVLALGAYCYTPALAVHVGLAAVTTLVLARRLRRRDLLAIAVGAGAALLVLVPYLLAFRDPLFTQRTAAISVFHGGVDLPAFSLAWNHYWAQWDPTFLFLRGTVNLRNEPGMGVLLLVVAPLLVVGVAALVTRRRASDLLLLGWLAVAPIAAALTSDGVPHFARGIFALPAIVLAVARGGAVAWGWISAHGSWRTARLALVVAELLMVVQLWGAYGFYFERYPNVSASAWRVGTGAALGVIRDRVPAGATACLDTRALSYYTFPQFVAWYLQSVPFTVVEGLSDRRCRQPGAYLFGHPGAKVPAGLEVIVQMPGADAGAAFILWRVPG